MPLNITFKAEDAVLINGTHIEFETKAKVIFHDPTDIVRVDRHGKETRWSKENAK